jgi:hypothetical protein
MGSRPNKLSGGVNGLKELNKLIVMHIGNEFVDVFSKKYENYSRRKS